MAMSEYDAMMQRRRAGAERQKENRAQTYRNFENSLAGARDTVVGAVKGVMPNRGSAPASPVEDDSKQAYDDMMARRRAGAERQKENRAQVYRDMENTVGGARDAVVGAVKSLIPKGNSVYATPANAGTAPKGPVVDSGAESRGEPRWKRNVNKVIDFLTPERKHPLEGMARRQAAALKFDTSPPEPLPMPMIGTVTPQGPDVQIPEVPDTMVGRAANGTYSDRPQVEKPSMVAQAAGVAPPAAAAAPGPATAPKVRDTGESGKAVLDALDSSPKAGSGKGDWKRALLISGLKTMAGKGDTFENLADGAIAGLSEYDRTKLQDEANAEVDYQRRLKRAEVGHNLDREGMVDERNAGADARDQTRLDIAAQAARNEEAHRARTAADSEARTAILREQAARKTGLDKVYELEEKAAAGDANARAALEYGKPKRIDPAVARALEKVLENPMASPAEKDEARRALGLSVSDGPAWGGFLDN